MSRLAELPVPRFSAPVSARTGQFPDGPVAADFNGDGKPDLATADEHARSVSVLLGRGDGSFWPRRAFRTAPTPVKIAAVDVDGDGDTDLVTASYDDAGSITVLRNDGAGAFRQRQVYAARAAAVGARDLNADGVIDLVIGGGERGGVGVLLGSAPGVFGSPRRFRGQTAYNLALGDLNGDGRVDVVTTPSDDATRLAIRYGNGDGTFGPEQLLPAGDDPLGVTLADLNHDARLDVLTADFYGAGVSVYLGNGDGTFAPRRAYAMDREPATVVTADFDGDGHLDIAAGSNDGVPAVRRGRGDGTFEAPVYLEWLFGAGGAAADFNLDGRPDLAFGQTEGTTVKVFLNWTGVPVPPCVVIDVTSMPLRTARRYAGYAGCRIGRVTYRYARHVRRKLVISQAPRPGGVLPNGSSIAVVVSRGRR